MSRTRWNYRYFIRSVVVIMCVVFCVGCQKKSQETDLKTVSVREEEPESTPEDSREDTTEDVGKVKEEDTAKKKDDAVPDTEDRPEKLYVHVCGNVNQPGVYELQQDSRVFEAIEAAGGMTTTAAFSYLNQAELLKDGQQIYVPTREEIETDLECLSVKAPEGIQPSQEEGAAPAGSGNAPENTGISEEKIDLNTADASLLSTLSGIGQSKAEAIIAYRQEHGGFSSIEEIMNVEGIKEGTFSKIKDKISAG